MVEAGAAEGRIRIIIRDDGHGFKTGEETRLFDRFYKEPQHGGTGIGLSIARAIIERYKGTIYASNSEPHGAQFIILLPMS